ncbi:MAG: preprotein translocase subunit YajC [Planctomycetes bacterium]|nr:preprotein translocase subunit YajC [Planctomycetota bacterium]
MLTSMILFAQDEAKKAAPDGGIGGLFTSPMFPILLMVVAFIFLIILPAQRRQRKEQEALMSNLKKNDEVVTTAGIIGIVTNISDNGEQVTLKIDDNARMRVLKSAIVRIMKKDEPAKDAAASTAVTTAKPNA